MHGLKKKWRAYIVPNPGIAGFWATGIHSATCMMMMTMTMFMMIMMMLMMITALKR
jgi:hypothetical protein